MHEKTLIEQLFEALKVAGDEGRIEVNRILRDIDLKPQEPVFLLRASDAAAGHTMQNHVAMCGFVGAGVDVTQRVCNEQFRFLDWQRMNPELVKPGQAF
jgi:hypothetical protein